MLHCHAQVILSSGKSLFSNAPTTEQIDHSSCKICVLQALGVPAVECKRRARWRLAGDVERFWQLAFSAAKKVNSLFSAVKKVITFLRDPIFIRKKPGRLRAL